MQVNLTQKHSGSREQKHRDFEELAYPLMDRIYSTALRLVRNETEAEDLVQTTFLKAWRFFDKFERGTNFKGWIFRILMTTFINDYRKKKRQPFRADFEKVSLTFEDKSKKRWQDYDRTLTYGEIFDDKITQALDKLPEHFRIVVLLADVNDLSYKEIAAIVKIPMGTVMSRLFRGRKMLMQQLKGYAHKNGYVTEAPAY